MNIYENLIINKRDDGFSVKDASCKPQVLTWILSNEIINNVSQWVTEWQYENNN